VQEATVFVTVTLALAFVPRNFLLKPGVHWVYRFFARDAEAVHAEHARLVRRSRLTSSNRFRNIVFSSLGANANVRSASSRWM
jgi:hypothetical protein